MSKTHLAKMIKCTLYLMMYNLHVATYVTILKIYTYQPYLSMYSCNLHVATAQKNMYAIMLHE